MKKTVELQIGTDDCIRITRYSGTGRVNVHMFVTEWGFKWLYKFACSVGDLPEDIQAMLDRQGMGKTRNRRRKHKSSKVLQDQGSDIDSSYPLTIEKVLKKMRGN